LSLFNELKRRNVFRVGTAYVVSAWLAIQVVETLFPAFGFGDAALRIVTIVFAIGLIPTVIFAWAFELTPEGLKKERDVDRSRSITPRTGRKLDRAIMVVLALALGYFAFDKFVLDPERQATQREEAVEQARQEVREEALVEAQNDASIAVLPFVNMSGDPDNEYFSDGISEELLNLLAKIPELRVISRTSAFSYKNKAVKVADVARELNVAHVLEGSVRKAGDRVRITAQLIRGDSDSHLWTETYDRTLEDIFAVQDEIAATVVQRLKVTLLGGDPHVEPTDPRAYTLRLQARHLAKQFSAESYEQAIALYEQALAIDPDYVEALGGLATIYINQAISGLRPAAEGFELAREIALKTLAVQPRDALAHVQLASIAIFHDNDLAAAARHYEQALELEPANDAILGNAAGLLMNLGRLEQAVALQEYATARDPLNAVRYSNLGTYYFYSARWDDAIAAYRTALKLSPNARQLHYSIGLARMLQGQPEAALEEFALEPDTDAALQGTTLALHALGRGPAYEQSLAEALDKLGETSSAYIAQIYAWSGDADNTFAWLAKAVEQKENGLAGQFLEPYYASVHSDPRWAEFLQRTGSSQQQRDAIEFRVTLPEIP
jgi:TolB-like protein/Flp pilus assembly protein TadD